MVSVFSPSEARFRGKRDQGIESISGVKKVKGVKRVTEEIVG
jgi:hypothetical protein